MSFNAYFSLMQSKDKTGIYSTSKNVVSELMYGDRSLGTSWNLMETLLKLPIYLWYPMFYFSLACYDMGGPRKEFLRLMVGQLSEKLVTKERTLIEDDDIVALFCQQRLFFLFGLIAGEFCM